MKIAASILYCLITGFFSFSSSMAGEFSDGARPDFVLKDFRLDKWSRFYRFSPNGEQVITSPSNGAIRIWDIRTGEIVHTLSNTADVERVEWNSNGTRIVTFTSFLYEGTVRLWNTETGTEVKLLNGKYEYDNTAVLGAEFSLDGTRLATTSKDRTVRIWDVQTGESLQTFWSERPLYLASFSSDGAQLLISNLASVKILEIKTGKELQVFKPEGRVDSARLSPDGKKVVTMDDGTVRVWSVETGEALHVLEGHTLGGLPSRAQFSPDQRKILSESGYDVRVWDVETGEQQYVLGGYPEFCLYRAQWSPDGKNIVTYSSGGTAQVWDIETGKMIRVFGREKEAFFGGQFLSDGTLMVLRIPYKEEESVGIWEATHRVHVETIFKDLDRIRNVLVPYKDQFIERLSTGGISLEVDRLSEAADTTRLFLFNVLMPFFESVDSSYFQRYVYLPYQETRSAQNQDHGIETLLDFKRLDWNDPSLLTLRLVRASAQSLQEALGQRVHQESLEKFLTALGKIEAQARVDGQGLTPSVEQALLKAYSHMSLTLGEARSSHRTAPFVMILESLREYFRG